jgi:hypothetical protein
VYVPCSCCSYPAVVAAELGVVFVVLWMEVLMELAAEFAAELGVVFVVLWIEVLKELALVVLL